VYSDLHKKNFIGFMQISGGPGSKWGEIQLSSPHDLAPVVKLWLWIRTREKYLWIRCCGLLNNSLHNRSTQQIHNKSKQALVDFERYNSLRQLMLLCANNVFSRSWSCRVAVLTTTTTDTQTMASTRYSRPARRHLGTSTATWPANPGPRLLTYSTLFLKDA